MPLLQFKVQQSISKLSTELKCCCHHLIVQSTFAATIATIIDADVAKRATTLLPEIEYLEPDQIGQKETPLE